VGDYNTYLLQIDYHQSEVGDDCHMLIVSVSW
jgi:hypothetical protein